LKCPPIIEPHIASNTRKSMANQPNGIMGLYKLLFIVSRFGGRTF
jgi:hypothetical protein